MTCICQQNETLGLGGLMTILLIKKTLKKETTILEQIIQNSNEIDSIEGIGDKVGQYKIQNKILVTINNSKNINISKIKKYRISKKS